jgi:predicted NAD/FAD-dependent oxidoreductase
MREEFAARAGDRWHAATATGRTLTAGTVILTSPVPQSLALLDAGGIDRSCS